jgi:hypothetical protein
MTNPQCGGLRQETRTKNAGLVSNKLGTSRIAFGCGAQTPLGLYMPPLDAAESIAPFLCIFFLDMPDDFPIALEPDAPGIAFAAPSPFGVPVPVPP